MSERRSNFRSNISFIKSKHSSKSGDDSLLLGLLSLKMLRGDASEGALLINGDVSRLLGLLFGLLFGRLLGLLMVQKGAHQASVMQGSLR